MTIDLEFITTATQDKNKYSISGIPDKLWDMFVDKAKEIMPEKGDKAWSAFLAEIIQKQVRGDKYTFIMTDIPQGARENFERAALQADVTMDHVVGVLFHSAMNEELHILNMISAEAAQEGYRSIVITGISNPAWQKWVEAARSVNMAAEELLGHMLEAASHGTLTLDKYEGGNDVRNEHVT